MEMETAGTYRVLQAPGPCLGTPSPPGVSTLEPTLTPASAALHTAHALDKHLHVRVKLLDNTMELFAVEVRSDAREAHFRALCKSGMEHKLHFTGWTASVSG